MLQINTYTCLDIETNGIASDCEIIELAAVKVENDAIVATFQELVKPNKPISRATTWLTGISDADVANCRCISKVMPDFINFIGGDILVGHNIRGFDFRVISKESERIMGLALNNDCIDTLELSRDIPLKQHTLARMCDYYGISNSNAHRALSDVLATNELYQKLRSGDRNENYIERYLPEKKPGYYVTRYSEQTAAIRQLIELLNEVLENGVVKPDEVYKIQKFLSENNHLKGSFPYDLINNEVSLALKNGILEPQELQRFCKVFLHAIDPISNALSSCDNEEICIKDKNVCLTGDFEHGKRSDVEEYLSQKGAIINKGVTKKLNYLIVGTYGSEAWSGGNYGNKIKKALEYKNKGMPIMIIAEAALFSVMEETND